MKLIIDIDEKVLEHIKIQEISLSEIGVVCESIANGKPYDEGQQGEWIDYSATFYKCPDCGYLLEKCCPECQTEVVLPKGDRE